LFTVKNVLVAPARVDVTVVITPFNALTVTGLVIRVACAPLAVLYNDCNGAAFTASGRYPSSLRTLISLLDLIDVRVSGIIVMSLKSNFLFI
jgi:hypothetical protein